MGEYQRIVSESVVANVDRTRVKFADVESNLVRCPDQKAATKMIRLIEKVRRNGDSVGKRATRRSGEAAP